MSSHANRIVPSPISTNTGILSTTKQTKEISLYYSKFLAMYYIDLMYNFIDVISNCCIHIFNSMYDYMNFMKIPFLNFAIVYKITKFNSDIIKDRYVYVEKHYNIIDVNAIKEVLAINFLERKRELYNFMENGYYYRELKNVMVNKKYEAKKQFSDISVILNNTQLNDDIKMQKIQEYIDKKNKKFASDIDFKLRFIPLESIEKKLISINTHIVNLKNLFINNWSEDGKKLFDEYKKAKIERANTNGGKGKKKRKKNIKGGIFEKFFSRFLSKRIASIPVDYIAIINKYKNNQSKEIEEIYNLIEEIVFYSLYYINIDKKEYGYLHNYNNRYITSESGISRIYKLKNTEKNYLNMSNLNKDEIITKNFKLLKNRYIELKKTLSISFLDEDIV